MTQDVLKQALEALENVTEDYVKNRQYKHNQAITAIKEAIAELESQEPMALPCCGYTDASAVKWLSLIHI